MIEDQLRASFAARADDTTETPDLTDRVIGRATHIRRRRTVLATAVTTVAAAVVGFLAISPGDQAADQAPVAGPRPAPVAFGPHHVLLSDGSERKVSDEPLRDVRRVMSGWLVLTDQALSYVPDSGQPSKLATGLAEPHVEVNRAGTRVAVQTWGDAPRVDVFALPSGARIGAAAAPDWIAGNWVGDRLLVSAPNGDAGTVANGLWNPDGPLPSLRGEMLVLGVVGEDIYAHVRDGSRTCLAKMRPDFTETARACDTGFRLDSGVPELSPDGKHLVGEIDGALVSVDVAEAFAGRVKRVPLGLSAGVARAAWESPNTVLFQVQSSKLDIRRCALDGSPCTPYVVPTVAGSTAIGALSKYPDTDTGPFADFG